jgi:uncharacterized protein YjbI with pentapeptide repeats
VHGDPGTCNRLYCGFRLRRVADQADIESGAVNTDADVKLAEADLSESMLHRAVLRDSDLRHARVHHTDFEDADLRGANLAGVDLLGASCRGAHVDLAQSGLFAIAVGLVVD